MANLTFADYIELTLAYGNEDRDDPDSNQKWRVDDVKRAINAGRRRMLRKVGLGLYRNTETVNATAGEITPPADFFQLGVLQYAPDSTRRTSLKPSTGKWMEEGRAGWDLQTGTPSSFVWNITPDGLRVLLNPQPAATVTNGLIWHYTAIVDDLEADADECPIMNLFPEFQVTTLQAGALRTLMLLEGGESDDQFVKWTQILEDDIEQIKSHINRLFVSDAQLLGK